VKIPSSFSRIVFLLHNFDTIETRGVCVYQRTVSVHYILDRFSFLHPFVTKVFGFFGMSIKRSLFYGTQEFSVGKMWYNEVFICV